jgi:hypothetical protein
MSMVRGDGSSPCRPDRTREDGRVIESFDAAVVSRATPLETLLLWRRCERGSTRLGRVVVCSCQHDAANVAEVFDAKERIRSKQNDVRLLSWRNRPDIVDAEPTRRSDRCGRDRFGWCHSQIVNEDFEFLDQAAPWEHERMRRDVDEVYKALTAKK